MTRMRRMNADEVERLLQKYDFELISQNGSHRKWQNAEEPQVIVPYPPSLDWARSSRSL